MMANHRRNKKYRKGFTLTEVLVTVVILAITVSLAAPAVIGGVRRVQLNRLDDSARAIFLAAQNSLTAMVGNGELDKFAEGVTDNKVIDRIAKAAPSDFPKKSGGDLDTSHGNPDDLRYLDSMGSDTQKAALKKLLPGGSIDKELEKHHYVVEYNYKTGAVYAVWYSDKEDFEKADAYTGEPRTYDERLKGDTLIGYYGGSGVDYAAVGQMPIPELTLTNAEELRLHIKMPACSFNSGDIGLEVIIKGETSEVSKTIIERETVAGNAVLLDKGLEADIMLDTLKAASDPTDYQNQPTRSWTARKPFKEWIKDSDLIPGEDISVTVTTYYAGSDDDALYLPQGATVSCNSLFASVEDTGTDPTKPIPTAMIAYGRHLQNLDAQTATGSTAGQIGAGTVGGVSKGDVITAAEQIRKIDFTAVNGTKDAAGAFTPGNDSKDIYYWANTYGTVNKTTGEITAPKPFTSIYNSALKSYDGSSLPIQNMNAEAQTVGGNACAGLFASIAGTAADHAQLKDITLIDTKATAENAAGALAGRAEYADFENCQVYLENRENIKPTGTGAGTDAEPVKMIQAGTYAGGMVGLAEKSHFSYCFASTGVGINNDVATVVNSRVGGLIGVLNGSASDSRVDKCYAAGYLTGTRLVGGLVGFSDQGSVVNSYAAGVIAEVTGTLYSGGIKTGLAAGLGCVDNDNTKNCYAAVRFGEKVMQAALKKSTEDGFVTVYGAKRKKTGHTIDASVYFIPQAGVKYAEESGTKVTSTQLSEMEASLLGTGGHIANDIWYQLPAEINDTANPTYATFPYKQTDETATLDTPYPYPMLKTTDATGTVMPMFHYGDWLEDYGASLCYFEDYGNLVAPRYGVWGYENGRNIDQPISNLKSGIPNPDDPNIEQDIVADGYGMLVLQNAAGKTQCPGEIKVTNGTLKPLPEDPADTNSKPKMIENVYSYNDSTTHEAYVYDLYPYTFEIEKDAGGNPADQQYYHSIYLFNQEYWFNFDYACEAVKASTTDNITTAGPQEKPRAAGFAASVSDPDNFNGKVVIRTARQLANMAADTGSSYENAATTPAEREAQQRVYVQVMDIDYSAYTGKVDGACSVVDVNGRIDPDGFKTGKTAGANAQSPAALRLSGSYDGNRFIIKNLYITSGSENSKEYAGLFGNTNGTFKNIYLVNVSVTGTSHVGALAGRFQGSATAANCGVYVDTSVTNAYDTFKIEGSGTEGRVGGLLGNVFSGDTSPTVPKLDGCFAAVKVEGHSRVGGLVGNFSVNQGDCLIRDCYSGGHTDSGDYTASGANVTGMTYVGGLIGRIATNSGAAHTVTLESVNYSTCSVKATGSSPSIGLLIGGCDSDANVELSTGGATCYAIGAAFDNNDVTPSIMNNETYLTSAPTEVKSVDFKTRPYDEALYEKDAAGSTIWTQPKSYPYATNLTAHHGDWVENSLEACFYWEKEGTDNYRVYVVGLTTSTINTLCLTHHEIDDVTGGGSATSNSTNDWGYGTIGLTGGLTGAGVSEINNTDSTAAAVITALKAQGLSFEDTDVKVYTGAMADASTTVNSVADSSKTYHLNLGFAAAISLENNLGTSGNPYQIRNVQQLDNIPNSSGSYYQQSHDLNGRDYTPVYTGESNFSGTYDGQSYRILELSMTNGLFTSLNGSTNLVNIILYSPSGDAKVNSGGEPAGGLAGSVTGSGDIIIGNCIVAGYTMSNVSQPLGGLVGKVDRAYNTYKLSITNSEAVNKLECNGSSYNHAGGLVGWANKGEVDITNSYAGGEITSGSYVGGIVGQMGTGSSGEIDYNNVYSYIKFSGGSIKYGIGACGYDLSSRYAPNYYNNCYYWEGCFNYPSAFQEYNYNLIKSQTWDQLKTCISGGNIDVDRTYWPANSTHTTGEIYPFPAVVQGYPDGTDGNTSSKQYVHYGDWPTS